MKLYHKIFKIRADMSVYLENMDPLISYDEELLNRLTDARNVDELHDAKCSVLRDFHDMELQNRIPYITNSVLEELKAIYPNQVTENAVSLPDALSRIKDATGQKFIVIIDEWDVLIRDEATNKKAQDDYINFLRGSALV